MLRVALVLLADVLQELIARQQAMLGIDGERPGVRSGIGNRDLFSEDSEFGTRVAFDRMELLSVRMPDEIEPEPVVEPDGVNDQRVLVPPASRVAVPGWIRIGRMRTSVHEDLA